MKPDVSIRLAEPCDAEAIAEMLACLARELGHVEPCAATPHVIRDHGFGLGAVFSSMVACSASVCVGLALFFRHFSTTRRMPGLYVQDLWVAPRLRGQRLGEQLLAASAGYAREKWNAGYLALTVYHDNPHAAHFYQRLGFQMQENDAPMAVQGPAFLALAGTGGHVG